MRRRLFLSLTILLFAGCVSTQTSSPRAGVANLLGNQRVLVLGDSITQDGRYVTFLEYYLHRSNPQARCDLISIGLSSETLSGLSEHDHPFPRPCVLERLDRALAAVKPDLVLACYGMNDGIYHPASPETRAAFNAGLHQLIAKVRATGARLVLITPPVFDPQPIRERTQPAGAADYGYAHPYAGYDTVLAEFAAMERSLHEPGVTVVDLHTPMAAALAAQRAGDPAFAFTTDGVHPGEAGHLFMARIIGAATGLTWPDEGLGRIQSDPLFALVRDRRRLRSEAWLPFVGYRRGETFRSPDIEAAEAVATRLQVQIDAQARK